MREDLFYHVRVFDECNDPHGTGTLGTHEGIHLIYFFYEPRPVSPEIPVGQLRSFDLEALDRFQDAGNFIIIADLFSFSPRHVTIIGVITNQLFPFIRHVGLWCRLVWRTSKQPS